MLLTAAGVTAGPSDGVFRWLILLHSFSFKVQSPPLDSIGWGHRARYLVRNYSYFVNWGPDYASIVIEKVCGGQMAKGAETIAVSGTRRFTSSLSRLYCKAVLGVHTLRFVKTWHGLTARLSLSGWWQSPILCCAHSHYESKN
jgi:hypothetical protein